MWDRDLLFMEAVSWGPDLRWQRSTWRYKEFIIYETASFPTSFIGEIKTEAVVDIILPTGKGIQLTEDWYTEEGYGLPIFKGEDCLKEAVEFIQNKDKWEHLIRGRYGVLREEK